MRAMRNAAVTLVVAALAVFAALSVYRVRSAEASSIADKDTLVIGVKSDQPGLGLRTADGEFTGFDVDVATYVAGRLGVARQDISFRATPSNVREKALREGIVDIVFATYSITPERKELVTFAGPYYVAHQDILVRAEDDSIDNVRDLSGKRLCQAAGSNSWRRVTEEREVPATLVPSASYSECVTGLAANRIDAVSTDDLILAGFAAARKRESAAGGRESTGVRLVNAPFTNEKYGVGLRKGDRRGCEAVNRILTEMYQDGTAETLLNEWFRPVGLDVTTTVPQFEGCA
jgi:glutamate transport system substrate-binding protein